MTTTVHGDFEWDSEKAASNLVKHGVSFEEAATVFASDDVAEQADAIDPARVITIGFSAQARILLVVSTETVEGRVRIISARKADTRERAAFAKR